MKSKIRKKIKSKMKSKIRTRFAVWPTRAHQASPTLNLHLALNPLPNLNLHLNLALFSRLVASLNGWRAFRYVGPEGSL